MDPLRPQQATFTIAIPFAIKPPARTMEQGQLQFSPDITKKAKIRGYSTLQSSPQDDSPQSLNGKTVSTLTQASAQNGPSLSSASTTAALVQASMRVLPPTPTTTSLSNGVNGIQQPRYYFSPSLSMTLPVADLTRSAHSYHSTPQLSGASFNWLPLQQTNPNFNQQAMPSIEQAQHQYYSRSSSARAPTSYQPSTFSTLPAQQEQVQVVTLLQLQQAKKGFSLHELAHVAKDLFIFLGAQSENGFFNFNLTPQTIAMNADNTLSLLTTRKPEASVLLKYSAPEVAMGCLKKRESLCWSAGVILAELFLNFPLFASTSLYDHLLKIDSAVGPYPDELIQLLMTRGVQQNDPHCIALATIFQKTKSLTNIVRPHDISSSIYKQAGLKQEPLELAVAFLHLIQGLLHCSPTSRTTPEHVLDHPFFQMIDTLYHTTTN